MAARHTRTTKSSMEWCLGQLGKLWVSKTGRWLRSGMDNNLSTFYRTLGLKTKPIKSMKDTFSKGPLETEILMEIHRYISIPLIMITTPLQKKKKNLLIILLFFSAWVETKRNAGLNYLNLFCLHYKKICTSIYSCLKFSRLITWFLILFFSIVL